MSAADKRVCVGIVAGAHGVRGAVRIKSFTAEPKDVARYGPLEDESGGHRFSLRLVGAAKGVLIGWLSGVADRDRAEALRGLRLYLPRAALPPTEEEEFYHADLIGLDAVLGDGTRRRRHAGNRPAGGAAGDGAVHPRGGPGRRSGGRPAGRRAAARTA